MGRQTLSTLAASLLLAGHASAALPSIVMKGSKFFYENGTQFFIKGIAYQQDTSAAGASSGSTNYIDPLANESNCARDIPIMAAAGTNTIRTYAIDPTADHSACMKLLDQYGIYVVSDLSEPALSINRDSPSWDVQLFNRYTSVVDELQKYSNVIGFFAGNEVTNNNTNTGASAFVKAAVRDVKAYIKAKNYRWMGVGYAANDDESIRDEIAHYFNCGNQTDAIDFWGYNIYSWCGSGSSYTTSGYDKQTEFFSNYSVPVFFAEYGCNTVGGAKGRVFDETTALYGSQMSPVFSGGIVYMYFEETNDFGLVTIGSDNSATTMADYAALSSKVLAATPSSVSSDSYNPTNSPAACPAINQNWQAASILPPTPDQSLCDCMVSSLTCAPASGLAESKYGDIFNVICGADAKYCSGFKANTTTGVYGAYAGCNSTAKLGWALDAYYKGQNNAASACDFNGAAKVVSASAASSCSAALSSASSVNAVAATATAGTASSGSGGTKKNAGVPNFSVAGTLYIAASMAIGAAMIAL